VGMLHKVSNGPVGHCMVYYCKNVFTGTPINRALSRS